MNKVKVQFSGGLGNQLFTYVAFKHESQIYNAELILDFSVVERVLVREADILSLKLDGEVVIQSKNVSVLEDVVSRIAWKNELTRKMFNRKLYPNLNDSLDLYESSSAHSSRGFFQTTRYFEKVENSKLIDWFSLREASNQFKSLEKEIYKSKAIALHVRRGDFLKYRNSFGLLSLDYFARAINILFDEYGKRPIWLFSDEPSRVYQEFSSANFKISNCIQSDTLNAAETMVLMSRAFALVTSNSTFSWWSGALSESQRVVYPSPWFRLNDGWLSDPSLGLPSWIPLESKWMN